MLWVEESDSHSLDSRRGNEKETSVWVWKRYKTESGCDVRPAKSVVARDHHKNRRERCVYHRPSRPVSQQHVGIPPRDPEVEMQASIFNSGGRCGGREEEERQCVGETSRV